MDPVIKNIPPKKLVGQSVRMSMVNVRTPELWLAFMPRRKTITNALGPDLISMTVYDKQVDPKTFNPHDEFEKWAAVEVADFNDVPEGMKTFDLTGGLYAVFIHKGSSRDFSTFQYIFEKWLPVSGYEFDHRPHFEVLGAKYKNDDPTSEEEIWVPIKPK